MRAWWRERSAEAMVHAASLPQAVAELGVVSAAHLMRRLASKKTPEDVKDRIALAMAPRMIAEARGRMPKGGRGLEGGKGGERPGNVLEAYRIETGR